MIEWLKYCDILENCVTSNKLHPYNRHTHTHTHKHKVQNNNKDCVTDGPVTSANKNNKKEKKNHYYVTGN